MTEDDMDYFVACVTYFMNNGAPGHVFCSPLKDRL